MYGGGYTRRATVITSLVIRGVVMMRLVGAAFFAVELGTDAALAPLGRHHPRSIDPWRAMAYMLPVTAFEIGDPIVSLVLVKSYDPSFHIGCRYVCP